MQLHGMVLWTGVVLAAGAAAQTPSSSAQVPPGTPTIRTETKLVLVDAVVTDKKGNYIKDLSIKDFKVLEDDKQQTVKTFSFGSDPTAPVDNRRRHLVLFFDLASMDVGDQMRARQEAAKFIDGSAGPDRLIAIVNFGGSLQIAQNFTDDVAPCHRHPAVLHRRVRLRGRHPGTGQHQALLRQRHLPHRRCVMPPGVLRAW